MVEKSHAGEGHYHIIFISSVDYNVVPDGSAGLCNVAYAAALCSLDVVVEREERVGAECNACDAVEILARLSVGERLGLDCEVLLPDAVRADVLFVFVDISVDDIVAVGTLNFGLERQVENLVMLTEEPSVRLSARETCAVDSRLLSRADADGLSVVSVADRVGLRVFKGDKRDDEVARSVIREVFVLGDDVCEELAVYLKVVSALL